MLGMFRDRDRRPYRDLLPWSGEFAGKYLTGAAQVYRLTGDPALRGHLERFVAELLPLQAEDGYFGPFPRENRLTGSAPNIDGKNGPTWDAWGHYHMILGLLSWHEVSGDARALGAAGRIGDLFAARFGGEGKKPRLVDTGSTEMNLAPAHGLLLLAERTGKAEYRALAEQFVGEFAAEGGDGRPLAGDYLRRGLAGVPFFQTPKPRWESLHPMQALAERGIAGGDAESARAIENLWWSIVELDRHNTGGFSSGEQAQGNPYHPGAIETCCTIAWMALSVDLLRLTGNPIVADELELSTWNAALGHYHPSGRWSTYNTPMDGVRKANSHEIVFQARPGSPELNCCSVNAARGLGLWTEWAVMEDAEGVVLNGYASGSVEVKRGGDQGTVRLTQETEYPRSGKIRIGVEVRGKADQVLKLRIPHWSAETKLVVRGEAVEARPGTYARIARAWQPGDVIELELDFRPRVWVGERECAGKASVYRGPVLLAFDPRFQADGASGPGVVEARELRIEEERWSGPEPAPMVLVGVQDGSGRVMRLCDFASAGADGSAYATWLPLDGAGAPAPAAFSRERPGRTARTGP
jgi:DUF1680 family protein